MTLGQPCGHCGVVMTRETSTPAGQGWVRVNCKLRLREKRIAWLKRKHPERLAGEGSR